MGQKGKFLVTNEGRFDLGTHMWDDQLFSDILVRDNPIDTENAMGISRCPAGRNFADGVSNHHHVVYRKNDRG